jgi:hypothetical protein
MITAADVAVRALVPGHLMRRGDRLRFRRAMLAKVDAEHDQHRNRQELALPVLEAFVPELRVSQGLNDRLRWPAMLDCLFIQPARAAGKVQPER